MELVMTLLVGLALVVIIGLLIRLLLNQRHDSVDKAGTKGLASRRAGKRGKREADLEVAQGIDGRELRLNGQALLSFDLASEISVAQRKRTSLPYAVFFGKLIEQPGVLEVLSGGRFVVARVPEGIRKGTTAFRTSKDGVTKAVEISKKTGQVTSHLNLVGGGAAVGAAAVFAPAIIASAATAQAQHRIEAAIEDLQVTLDEMGERLRDADLGVVLGARELLAEVGEWGPAHLWPEQLKWELAVRRAALDPVWYTLRRELERTVDRMVKNGTKFVGLHNEEHDELRRKAYELTLALLVRAQLDYSTALVLVDSEDAPFGLERLDRIEALFREDLQSLQAMFESAINGSRPLRLTNASRRAKRTEAHVQGVIEYLVERISDLENSADDSLVLSLAPDGAILVEVLSASATETAAITGAQPSV
jgi:hypothetical protein